MPNTIKCRGCASILRYSLSKMESFILGVLGLLLALMLAFLIWHLGYVHIFAYIYIPLLLVIFIVVSFLEVIYVRKYHQVQIIA